MCASAWSVWTKPSNGRILATEILVKNHAVANHIREGKTHQTRSIMEAARGEGMVTMDFRLKELYLAGLITWEEISRRISSPKMLKDVPQPGPMQGKPPHGEPGPAKAN